MDYGTQILDFSGRRLRGQAPFAWFEVRNGEWSWQSHRGLPWIGRQKGADKTAGPTDELDELRRALAWCQVNIGPDGGAIGYISYEGGRRWDTGFRPGQTEDRSRVNNETVPDLRLVFHERLEESPPPPVVPGPVWLEVPVDEDIRAAYLAGVRRIREYIAAGDIYQANLTWPFTARCSHSPATLYDRLRALSPAPHAALLEWPDFAIVSNSPERFLSLRGGLVTASPIKGTAPRGVNPISDERLRDELEASAKDRAENVMIVDLLRNDLGRVCEFGTVHVPRLFEVATLPGLHHLVSTVEGRLGPGRDGLDLLRAAFPCGSITGAPKLRAMEILSELETVPRGAAMGAMGYIGFDGDMEWNVAIRTATVRNGLAHYHVGAGIVADSVPEFEYQEVLLKARALWSACAGGSGS